MCGIDGDGCQQQVQFSITVLFDKSTCVFIELVEAEYANSFFRKLRAQLFIPALVLLGNKFVYLVGYKVALFG